jgi:hypothetical protein
MFVALFHRLWNENRVRRSGTSLRTARHLSYRPRLEPLERRELPAFAGGGLMVPAVPYSVIKLYHMGSPAPAPTTPIHVTVAQNSPPTVIDMDPIFAAVRGQHHEDGLRLSVLGNTNSVLVRTELSDSALTLTYMRGQHGTASITVCATDADGVSVQQTVLVTVLPLRPGGAVAIGRTPSPSSISIPPVRAR